MISIFSKVDIYLLLVFSMITSKDAYMLIYARRDSTLPLSNDVSEDAVLFQQPEPSYRAMKDVDYLNDEHVVACKAYTRK